MTGFSDPWFLAALALQVAAVVFMVAYWAMPVGVAHVLGYVSLWTFFPSLFVVAAFVFFYAPPPWDIDFPIGSILWGFIGQFALNKITRYDGG